MNSQITVLSSLGKKVGAGIRICVPLMILISLLLANCAPIPALVEPTAVSPTKAPNTKAPSPAGTKAPAPEYIEIGASIPLTGKYGSLGNMVLPGYEFAIEDINATGGVYVSAYDAKIPLRLTYYDDESNPDNAANQLESLYSEQKVVAYLGGAASDMHAATSAIAEKNKVPYCGVAFALWQIHQQGYKYLFSPFPKSPDQARGVFEFLNEALPEGERPHKVAIFVETTVWGKELGRLWEKYADQYNYTVVFKAEYAPRTTDMSGMILNARATEAEILLALPSPPDGITLVEQMADIGWTPKYSLIIRAPESDTWGADMGKNGDYITIFPGWHNGLKYPGVAELNAKYQAKFGRPADLLTGPAYTCVQVLAAAIEKAGSLDRDAIRDALAATDMMTVDGPVTFNIDGTGNVLNPMVQWQNGKLELIWPLDQATAKFMYPALPFDQR